MPLFHKSSDPQPDWVTVLLTNNPAEAHVVAGRLQSEGLGAWVHQEPYGSAMGITVGKLGELRVLVPPHEYDRAVEILETDPVADLPEDVDQIVFDADADDWDDTEDEMFDGDDDE